MCYVTQTKLRGSAMFFINSAMIILKIIFIFIDLAREVVNMWDVGTAVIVPIVVSANGLIAKSLDQHLRRLSLGSWIKGMIQKAVLLDTARIVRRFLSQEP